MNQVTKTKIIIFASLGLLTVGVIALWVYFADKRKPVEIVNTNTSLRSQQQSDFTLDDMLQGDDRPEYDKYSYEDFPHPVDTAQSIAAIQEQLRKNSEQPAYTPPPAPPKPVPEDPPAPDPVPEKKRFFSGDKEENTGNTIQCQVMGDQQVSDGHNLKLVLLQELPLDNGITLSKGSVIFGVVKLSQDRIHVSVQSARINNNIYPLDRKVYDQDGMEGISVSLNIKAEVAKEGVGDVVDNLNVSTYDRDLLSQSVSAVGNAAKSVFRRHNNQLVVTVRANYKLLLK